MQNMAKPRRTVLVVDGSEKNCDGYKRQLQQDAVFSYQVIIQQTLLNPLSHFPDSSIDGILLDLEILRPGEFHFFDQLRASLEESCPPLVVVGNGDPDYIVQAFKHGAADYLVRDNITGDELCRCLRTAIENAELKRQLQRSRNRFHTSVESLMDCFGIFSATRDETGQIIDFRIDYMNQAACENNRMPRERQIGQGLCQVLPGHRESGLFDAYCHLVETGDPLVKESVFFEDTYGGHQEIVRAFDIRATRLDDGLVASWRDITERKRMELELSQTVTDLQREQGRLQRLIDTAPIGIGISTASGEVEVINDTMLALHGYSREEFEERGMNWWNFVPPESKEAAEQSLVQLRQQGTLPPHERELQRLDGTRVPVWFSATQWVYSSDEHVTFAVDLTTQKKTEAALRRSRQRYRELAEAMPQIVLTANAAGQIDYWNQRWYEYTGLSEAESMGLDGIEAVHPEERDFTLSQWQQALTRGEPFEMEYRIRRHDGIYRWFICRALPTQDEQGQIKGWIGTITDIEQLRQTKEQLRQSEHQLRQELTERSRAEAALRRVTEHLDLVLKSAPIILCTQDRDLRYTWVYNPDLNLSEEEIIGRRDEDLLSPDSAQHLVSIKQQVLDTGIGLRQEIEVVHSDRAAYYDLTIDPLWDENNAVVGIACAAVNITDRVRLEAERLQAEATLLENERLLRLALSGANAGSWSWEVATCKMNWSPENCVLYGFNPAQGSPSFDAWFNTIHPEDQDRVNRDIANVIEQRFPTYRSEFRIHHPQKGTRWMLGQGRLTLDDQGNPTRLSGINLDITDQKTAAARQEELLQREQAARAEAERANRVKDEFLAILSHELRSPLNPILGWSKLLQQKQFAPEKTQQALTTIERNAKLQTQLIDDLLDIARILRGKLNLKTAPVDLSFVIQSAMETVKPAAEAKSIDIQYNSASADSELQETSLQVTGDEARLQQIIWNLLSNAIKFTPSGGRVEVCLEAVREQEREAARERDGERVEWRDSQVVGPTTPPPHHPSTQYPTPHHPTTPPPFTPPTPKSPSPTPAKVSTLISCLTCLNLFVRKTSPLPGSTEAWVWVWPLSAIWWKPMAARLPPTVPVKA